MVRPPLLPQRTSFRPFWEKITSPLTVQASVPTVVPSPPQVAVSVDKAAFESLTLERERGQRQPKTRATTCPVFRGWAGGLPM